MKTLAAEPALGRKKTGRRTTAVKIDASVKMKAERVCEDRGIDLSDYITEMIRDRVEREWLKLVKRAAEATEGDE